MGGMNTTTPPTDLSGWRRILEARGLRVEPKGDPRPPGETTEEAAERKAIQANHRSIRWRTALPPMYAQAWLGGLTDDQRSASLGWYQRGGVNLVLAGSVGAGKTYAAYALGAHAVGQGAWVEAWALVDLLDAMKPGKDPAAEQAARACDLLILDDLGTERATEWAQERVLAILDDRVRGERQTVVTTNTTGERLGEVWGTRLLDRLTYRQTVIVFSGPSRRKAAW